MTGESAEVKIGEGACVALVILDQSPEAGGPGEGSLDQPVPRQQHEAALGLRQLHHLQFDTMRPGGLGHPCAGITLVNISQFDALSGGGLHSLGQAPDLGPVIRAGGRDMQSQQVAQRVDRQMQLGTDLPWFSWTPGGTL